jgi:hypothetical protein
MVRNAVVMAAVFVAGVVAGVSMKSASVVQAQGSNRVFEIRTYTAPEGKLDALKARFRDHTIAIFNKHDMKSVGYWTPQDAPLSQNTLIYILAHPSRQAAKTNWDAFRTDPEWVKAKADSEVNGPLTTKVESVFVDPTDFSPIK